MTAHIAKGLGWLRSAFTGELPRRCAITAEQCHRSQADAERGCANTLDVAMKAPFDARGLAPSAAGMTFFVLLTAMYWSGLRAIGLGGVSRTAAWVLYVCCLSAWGCIRARVTGVDPPSPGSWLMHALQTTVLALLFYGANEAREILYGSNRLKAATPVWLGGLELWWILAGATLVAVAAAAARAVARP